VRKEGGVARAKSEERTGRRIWHLYMCLTCTCCIRLQEQVHAHRSNWSPCKRQDQAERGCRSPGASAQTRTAALILGVTSCFLPLQHVNVVSVHAVLTDVLVEKRSKRIIRFVPSMVGDRSGGSACWLLGEPWLMVSSGQQLQPIT
jgi:hypothetical protein